jgi:GTP cyclohydrolase I
MVVASTLHHCSSTAEFERLDVAKSTLEEMQAAVRKLIAGVGEDAAREGLIDTPRVRIFCPS